MAPVAFRHSALTVESGEATAANLVVHSLTVAGQDLETLLEASETDRLKPGALTASNFAPGSVTSEKLASSLPVYLGGTGLDLDSGLYDGMIVVGAGSNALGAASALAWSDADAALHVAGDVELDGFILSGTSGTLALVAPGGESIDLLDYRLGVPPAVTIYQPDQLSSGSSTVLSFSVASGDSPARSLHVAWYDAGLDQPRLPPEVVTGAGALGTAELDLSVTGLQGEFSVTGLDASKVYVVRATAMDARGNLSVAGETEASINSGVPVVARLGSYYTSPAEVGFASSNEPDESDMLLVAGLLTAASPAITEADIDANLGLFHSETIVAGAHADIAVRFSTAHDPGSAFAPTAVAEATAYYPFVMYRDALSNAVIRYGEPALVNPDFSPPTVDVLSVTVVPGTSNALVAWEASDVPNGQVQAVHVVSTSNPGPLTAEEVKLFATASYPDAASSDVFRNVPAYHSTHVSVVAEDSAHLSAVASATIPVPVIAFTEPPQQSADSSSVTWTSVEVDAATSTVTVRLVLFKDAAPGGVLTSALSNAVLGAEGYAEHEAGS